jgi:MFS family permease
MFLLGGGMAALYGMLELAAGTATLTFEEVGGSESLAGFAPAVFLAAAAVAALPAGRAMDRHGRRPVLAAGFGAGIVGSLGAALGLFVDSIVLVLLAFVLVGVSIGTVLLSRAAAADMYPPERRARGIALILFGAVFGALLGPVVFIPLLSGHEGHGSALGSAWLGAAGFVLVGLILMGGLRPDPKGIARALGHDQAAGGEPAGPAAPLRDIIARPGVLPALLGSAASWAAMVPMMTLVGSALVDHGHSESAIIPVVSVHFVGMFGLFAIVGRVIDRVGTSVCLSSGLLLLSACAAALLVTVESVPLTAVALLGVGLGWNFAFVAATADLSERVSPSERGTLLGFSDLLSDVSSAGLVVLGGVGLATAGLATVALGAAAVAALPALWILRQQAQPAPA